MIKKILFLILLFPSLAWATVYHVATDGSGDFTTIAQANAATFVSGDSILFKRGDTWREQLIPDSGDATGYITYGAYGTGAKPLLLGSKQENDLTDWTDLGGNIWSNNDASFTIDVGNIIFNNGASCGVKKQAEASLLAQGDFWYDFTNDLVKVYSVGNPASVYTNIECALAKHIIPIVNKTNIAFENLDLRYGANHGFACNTVDSVIIRNCDLSFIGGGDFYGDYTVRYGNGIEFWIGAKNILVEGCHVDNIYDAAYTTQGNGNYIKSNIIFRNNLASNSEYSIEAWERDNRSSQDNIRYVHNTCINAGGGWSHNQRWDGPNGTHLRLSLNTATTSNFIIKNNIFDTSTDRGVWIINATDIGDWDIDYNVFNNCTNVGRIVVTNYTTLADWQIATSQDLHSLSSDPLLTSSYRLKPGSPCINAGVDVDVDTDYFGHRRGGQVDIGAVEFGTYIGNATLGKGTWN